LNSKRIAATVKRHVNSSDRRLLALQELGQRVSRSLPVVSFEEASLLALMAHGVVQPPAQCACRTSQRSRQEGGGRAVTVVGNWPWPVESAVRFFGLVLSNSASSRPRPRPASRLRPAGEVLDYMRQFVDYHAEASG